MASENSPTRCAIPRSDSYQRYLEAHDSTVNLLIGLFAGRAGLHRMQRHQTLKYFNSLPEPSKSQGSEDEDEETQVAKEVTSGHPVRHILSREDSKISNSGTSYYSAISYQSIKEENVLKHGNSAQLPIILHVQDLSAPYTVSVPSDPKHITAGPRSALRFPVASARPRIYLDLDADCAEAAKWPTSPKAVVPPPDPEIKKIHPLTAYLTQDNKAARWDIRDWISDVAAYQKELRERVRRPRELLQCPEYYMMKNFNRLNVHKPWSPKEERTNKNMAAIMMSTGWAAEPTIHRRIQLAREEEARKVRARVDEAHKAQARAHQAQRAQARTARAAIAAEAAFLERQARKAREVSESPKTDIKPEVHKLANTHKVHFAVCEVPRTAKKAPKTPASALKSIDEGPRTILKVSTVTRTTLEPIDEVPTPTDAISQNERFKIERSAPIDIPKPSKYRGGPKVLSENMRRGMRLIAASQAP